LNRVLDSSEKKKPDNLNEYSHVYKDLKSNGSNVNWVVSLRQFGSALDGEKEKPEKGDDLD